jgi:branched-subunit amino acid transport protein
VAILAAGGLATWLLRIAFIALAPSGHPPALVARALRHAAPAAFAALVAVGVSDAATGSGPLAGWPVLAATAVTAAVARRSRNVPLTLLCGVVAITAFTWI